MSSASSQCSTKEDIRRRCIEAGAVKTGFATVGDIPAIQEDIYSAWINSGRNAAMEYMAKYAELRRNPATLIDDIPAKTIIVTAFAFDSGTHHPLISDYALGDDYHTVLRRRLQPVAQYLESLRPGSKTRICIDTAPLRERFWATRAGVGYIGLNGLLIVPKVGADVFLASILWTEEVTPDESLEDITCRRCGACIKACPGGALRIDGSMDCRKCLSYLTIEHRGDFPGGTDLHGRIYGCDTCRRVCPESTRSGTVYICPEFLPRHWLMAMQTAEDFAALSQEDFSKLFAGSAVKRAKLAGILRNSRLILGTKATHPRNDSCGGEHINSGKNP